MNSCTCRVYCLVVCRGLDIRCGRQAAAGQELSPPPLLSLHQQRLSLQATTTVLGISSHSEWIMIMIDIGAQSGSEDGTVSPPRIFLHDFLCTPLHRLFIVCVYEVYFCVDFMWVFATICVNGGGCYSVPTDIYKLHFQEGSITTTRGGRDVQGVH